jgi:hypothetical protein
MRTALVIALVAVLPALPARGVDSAEEYRHGRFRLVEGGVFVQSAEATGSEEATRHLPYLPGDRVWTDAGGRAEFQFADGSLLRLDYGSKLDYVDHVEGRDERIALRLWAGSVFLRARDRSVAWEVETPAGFVTVDRPGVVRVDATAGVVRVSVYEGEASLEAERTRTALTAGQRAVAERGYGPSLAEGFDRAEEDEFAAWNASLDDRREYAEERYLPDEIDVYAADLEGHGDWSYETEVGYVWRPNVGVSWQPYRDGRWVYTVYGWTWVPQEPWGWAPFHYGRWGYSGNGWYWVPGHTWGPAWVSWSVGNNYVGWCALGYRDRPVPAPHHGGNRGQAVPRGSRGGSPHDAWNYVRRDDLGSRDVARRRVDVARVAADPQRVIDTPGVRLGRNLEAGEAPRVTGARPRPGRGAAVTTTRPTVGDFVPELRDDPATTIPAPGARRRSDVERRQSETAQPDTGTARDSAARARPRTPSPSADGTAVDPSWSSRGTRRTRPGTTPQPATEGAAPRTDVERFLWREGGSSSTGGDRARQREQSPRTRGRGEAPVAEPQRAEPAPEARPRSGGDDSVERFLRSLSSPRDRERGGGAATSGGGREAAPRGNDGGRERAAPRGSGERPQGQERAPRSYGERPQGQERAPRSYGERPQGQERAPRAEPRRENPPPPKPQSSQPSSSSGSGRARHRDREN